MEAVHIHCENSVKLNPKILRMNLRSPILAQSLNQQVTVENRSFECSWSLNLNKNMSRAADNRKKLTF